MNAKYEKDKFHNHLSIQSPSNAYLQHVDSKKLIGLLSNCNVLLGLHHRPGSHLVKGMEIGLLHPHADMADKEMEELIDQFVIGKSKTAQQDLELSIHQMVEIASRAFVVRGQ